MDGYVSVAEAAQLLGVSRARAYQRVRDGSLPAHRIGGHVVISRASVDQLNRRSSAGRPLSPASAWALIAVSLGADEAAYLAAPARSRARKRLSVLRHEDLSPEDVPRALSPLLRGRASRCVYGIAAADLPDLRSDLRVHLSGVSSSAAELSAGDVAEGYVLAQDLPMLREEYLLGAPRAGMSEVVLHAVSEEHRPPLGAAVRSPLLLAADLVDWGGPRERQTAARLLNEDVHV